MEINSYQNSVQEKQELEKLKQELLSLLGSEHQHLEARIESLGHTQAITNFVESLNHNSLIYRQLKQVDYNQDEPKTNSSYLSNIDELSLLQAQRETASMEKDKLTELEAMTMLQDLQRYSLSSYESKLLNEYASVLDNYTLYSWDILNRTDLHPDMIEYFRKLEEEFREDFLKLKEQKELEKERARLRKYVDDFKTMLKAFSPGSPSAQATEVLIGVYTRLLGYL